MFLPLQTPSSPVDPPYQITVEFTDYASYQHHQLRRQQYQEELERQSLQQQQQLYQQPFPQQPAVYLPQQSHIATDTDTHQAHPTYYGSAGAGINLTSKGNNAAFFSPTVLFDFTNLAYSESSFDSTHSPETQEAAFTRFHHGPLGIPPSVSASYPHSVSDTNVETHMHEEERHNGDHPLQLLQPYHAAITPPLSILSSPNSSSTSVHIQSLVPPQTLASAPTALTAATAALAVIAPALPYPTNAASSSHCVNSTVASTISPPAPPLPALAPAAPDTATSAPASSSPAAHQLHLRRQAIPGTVSSTNHYLHNRHLLQKIQRRRTLKAQSFTRQLTNNTYPHITSEQSYSSITPSQYPRLQVFSQTNQFQQKLSAAHPPYFLSTLIDDMLHKTDDDQAAFDANIAAQEEAARNYKPDVNGPGIGELRSTEEIKNYYASADQILVEKTANLPKAYPLYRAVRGDGNCGWRAIGFCYFEALIYKGNLDLIVGEKSRLLDLNDYIREVGGYDPYVYEDMVEETEILFDAILKALPDTEHAIRVLTDAFNDDSVGNAIIYHLRLLAASYLKGNVETYEGFIAHDAGVIGYCQEWIERPNCEIDHLRVEVLASILLKPSDIVLEIAYLDRSHGSSVTVYNFPDKNIGRLEETIVMRVSLLFRPDHYDILYRPSLPSEAAAKAAQLCMLPVDAAVAAIQPTDLPPNGTQPEQQSTADATSLSGTVAADIGAQAFTAPTSYYDLIVQQANTPYIQEDTPGLTPGSLSNSLVLNSVMEQPPTPAYASPAPPDLTLQQPVTEQGDITGQGNGTSATAAAAAFSSADFTSSAADSEQGPTSATSSTTCSTAQPRSVHDREVHHVGFISYSHASQSMGRLDNFGSATPTSFQLLSHHLPGIFGRFQSQRMSPSSMGHESSALCNIGSPLSTGMHKEVPSFTPPPEAPRNGAQNAVPKTSIITAPASSALSVATDAPEAEGTQLEEYTGSYPELPFSTAKTPSSMMNASTRIPEAAISHSSCLGKFSNANDDVHKNSGALNIAFLPEPKSTPVRFTKWHFNRLPHAATDPNSSMFRNSRGSTAHFDNPDFQPQEYDPSTSGSDAAGSRNRRRSSVIREVDDKKT